MYVYRSIIMLPCNLLKNAFILLNTDTKQELNETYRTWMRKPFCPVDPSNTWPVSWLWLALSHHVHRLTIYGDWKHQSKLHHIQWIREGAVLSPRQARGDFGQPGQTDEEPINNTGALQGIKVSLTTRSRPVAIIPEVPLLPQLVQIPTTVVIL